MFVLVAEEGSAVQELNMPVSIQSLMAEFQDVFSAKLLDGLPPL